MLLFNQALRHALFKIVVLGDHHSHLLLMIFAYQKSKKRDKYCLAAWQLSGFCGKLPACWFNAAELNFECNFRQPNSPKIAFAHVLARHSVEPISDQQACESMHLRAPVHIVSQECNTRTAHGSSLVPMPMGKKMMSKSRWEKVFLFGSFKWWVQSFATQWASMKPVITGLF